MPDKEKRDDFTWLLLLLERGRRQKKIPLRAGRSYYRSSDSYSQGFRFSDERKAEEEQEEIRKRMRRAKQQGIAYLIFMIALSVILTIILH